MTEDEEVSTAVSERNRKHVKKYCSNDGHMNAGSKASKQEKFNDDHETGGTVVRDETTRHVLY